MLFIFAVSVILNERLKPIGSLLNSILSCSYVIITVYLLSRACRNFAFKFSLVFMTELDE